MTRPRIVSWSRDLPSYLDRYAGAELEHVAACWVTADDDILESRIRASANYEKLSPEERLLVDKFVHRNNGLNRHVLELAQQHRLQTFATDGDADQDRLSSQCLEIVAE